MGEFGSSEAGRKGGKARARKLTKSQRSEIARKAVNTRWNADLPESSCEGEFQIGEVTIRAAVLANGKRLLTQGTFLRAIGRSRTPKAGTGVLSTVDGVPFFLQADLLKPFLTEDLMVSTTPIFFRDKNGRRSIGYDAELLPKVAEVYLKLRDSFPDRQIPRQYAHQYEHIVRACDIVMRGLARVGIVALVDEATGYQDERARNALAKILEDFVAEELRKWIKTFPLEYFREMCRLRGIAFAPNMRLPRYFGHLTNDIIYSRMAPGVFDELRQKNPSDGGRRKHKHHQWLTEDIGHPNLLMHLGSIVSLMKMSDTWDEFKEKVDKLHPPYRPMPLFDHLEDEGD